MVADLDELGSFDLVLYLGVLYHVENPLQALKRLASVTKELAVIETSAIALPFAGSAPLCEFFETDELNNDGSNWWAPNNSALEGMCRAAGFRRVQVVVGPSVVRWLARSCLSCLRRQPSSNQANRCPMFRYRAVVHAWK
jgi:tRNA (mo5U34)-methyltransferase